MTLSEMSALAIDEIFRARVRANAVSFALVVLAEDPQANKDLQNKRGIFAGRIIEDGGARDLDRLAWTIACTLGFTVDAADKDIDVAVQMQWDNLSGVYGWER